MKNVIRKKKKEFKDKELQRLMIQKDYQIRSYIKPHVHILIYSDGQENSSKIYTTDNIKTLIQINVEHNHYTFYYCGDYSIDAHEIASQYGIPKHLTESYICSDQGFKAFFRMIQRLIKELAEHGKLISDWKELTKGASPLDGIKDKNICEIFTDARQLLKTNEDIFSKLEISAINVGYDDNEFKKLYSITMANINEIKNISKILQENGYTNLTDILYEYIKKQQHQAKSIQLSAITHSIRSLLSVNLINLEKLENASVSLKSTHYIETLCINVNENIKTIKILLEKNIMYGFMSMKENLNTLLEEQRNQLYLILCDILKNRRYTIKQIIVKANYDSFKIKSDKLPNIILIFYKKLAKTFYFDKIKYEYHVNIIKHAISFFSLSPSFKKIIIDNYTSLKEYINDDSMFTAWLKITDTIIKE